MLKALYTHIYLSCTNVSWYAAFFSVPLKKHLSALFFTLLLSSIIFATRLAIMDIPGIERNALHVIQEIKTNFPPDLVVSWKDNTLQINRTSLSIPIPHFFANDNALENTETLEIFSGSIDASTATQLLNEREYIADNQNVYFMSNGALGSTALSEIIFVDAFMIDSQSINSYLDEIKNLIPSIKTAWYITSPVIILVFLLILRMLSLMIDSFLLFILLKVSNSTFSYKTVFLISLNAMIPSELIYQFSQFYNTNQIPTYGIVFWIYVIIAVLYISFSKKRDQIQ